MTTSLFIDGKEYRPIPGHALWFISDDGTTISTRKKHNGHTGEPHQIRPYRDRYGYLVLPDRKQIKVHVAVLSAWVRLPEVGEQVRHLNNNRTDNRLCNLVWGTAKENGEDRTAAASGKGEKNGQSRMTAELVLALREKYRNKPLTLLAAEHPEFSKFAIWAAVSGYSWGHLPGAIVKNRRCSKDGWRSGMTLRAAA